MRKYYFSFAQLFVLEKCENVLEMFWNCSGFFLKILLATLVKKEGQCKLFTKRECLELFLNEEGDISWLITCVTSVVNLFDVMQSKEETICCVVNLSYRKKMYCTQHHHNLGDSTTIWGELGLLRLSRVIH